MTLIAITGLAHSGKDTFAKGLIEKGFIRLAFADALKDVTAMIADEDPALYHDNLGKEQYSEALGKTRRMALQEVGSGIRNTLGKETWVNRALRRWIADGRPDSVITDCRYDNEADAVIALGGIIVRIERPDNVGLTGAAAQHESENGVSINRISIFVRNDHTMEDLIHAGRSMAETFHEAVH
jgi:hypothetical protein